MARNQEKIDRNRIREKYAREYAGKLKQKDGQLAALCVENDKLRARIRLLEEKSALDQVTIRRQDELVKTLQAWSELSESELENMRRELAQRAERAAQAGKLDGAVKAMSRMFETALSDKAVQSAMYAMCGLGPHGP